MRECERERERERERESKQKQIMIKEREFQGASLAASIAFRIFRASLVLVEIGSQKRNSNCFLQKSALT